MPSNKKGVILLKEEIVSQLTKLSRNNEVLVAGTDLYQQCRQIFSNNGILDKFDPYSPENLAKILSDTTDVEEEDQNKSETAEQTEVAELESRALNSSELKILLDEYDKHKSLKDAEKIATEIQKNPLLKRFKPDDIWKVIKRKIELEAEIATSVSDKKSADLISDQILITESKLEELGGEDRTDRPKDQEITVLAKKIVEVSQKGIEENRETGTKKAIAAEKEAESTKPNYEVTAENILIVDGEVVLANNRNKTIKMLDEMKIVDPKIRAEAVRIVADITAESVVGEQIDTATEYITSEIVNAVSYGKEDFKLKEEQIVEIGKVIHKRLETKILESPLSDLGDHQVITKDDGKVKTVETGPTLVEEIEKIIGKPIAGETLSKTNVVIKTGDEVAVAIATQNSNPETGLKTDNKGNVKITTNDVGVVDLYRAVKLEDEVFERMAVGGESTEKAREAARFVRELNFPTGETSTTITQIQADRVMRSNGFDGGDNETRIEEARIIKNLIKSPVKISQNVEKILNLSNKLNGVKGFDKLNKIATVLKNEPRLIQSLEFVRGIVRFQDKLRQITGVFTNPIGNVLKIPAIQNFAVRIATRLGVGEMATHIASFGLQQGIKSIAGEMFLKGSVGAVVKQIGGKIVTQIATKIAATTAVNATVGLIGGATGPVGWAVTAVIFVAQIAWKAVKKIYSKIEGVLKSLNIDTSGTKKFLQENFGKIPGGLMDLGMKAAMLLLAIPILIGGAIAGAMILVTIIIPIAFGSLLAMQGGLLHQISSLVAPRESVTGYCIKVGESANNPTGDINCNKNAPEPSGISVNKENFIKVAEMWRAGGGINAALCFNDVVARAKAAGINPEYALWAWLHESGASNYGGFSYPIKDFGINWQPTNDFNSQITTFLTLDPASACIGDPRIGGDYWLAFATNYLTGQCDPDFVDAQGGTGRKYLEEMQATWGWISSSPMPDNIHSGSGGSGNGGSSPKLNKVTGSDGAIYVCEMISAVPGESTLDSPLPTLDPNIQIPEGCPQGRPVSGGYISQGPRAKGCSHANMDNAVDFAVGAGTPIRATHDGVARVGSDSIYGNYVDIVGKCNGVTFTTRYAHMPNGGVRVSSNTKVTRGQVIGVVDNTGSSTGNHLHYDFRNVNKSSIPDISDTLGGLSHSLTGCCNAENGIMCN